METLTGRTPKSLHMVGFTRTKSPEFRGIKCFHITPAYHFNIITIKSPVSQAELKEIGAMHNYLMPLAKVKCGEGHLGNPVAQKIQSKTTVKGRSGLLLMVLASGDISRTVVTTPPLCPMRGRPTRMSQLPPASLPWRRTTLSPLCHSLSFVARPCILPCHFTFRSERGGRNVHYTW